MKKTYDLKYEEGKYFFEYSLPGNEEEKLVIDENKMEIDSAKLYSIFFEKVTESIEIVFQNKMDESLDDAIKKKGNRILETMRELCSEICAEIDKKCFPG